MRDLMIQDANLGGARAAAALDDRMKVMAASAPRERRPPSGHRRPARHRRGPGPRNRRSYGVHLAEGINPILAGTRQADRLWRRGRAGQAAYNADGNLYEKHERRSRPAARCACGPSRRPAARPTSRWPVEAWPVDGHLAADREAAERPGAVLRQWRVLHESDVPRPYSTAPYGPPLSTAATRRWTPSIQATADFVRENGAVWPGAGVGEVAGRQALHLGRRRTGRLRLQWLPERHHERDPGPGPVLAARLDGDLPVAGFVTGDGVYTVGSTPNAGGGIGHMAGTLLGVNVESRGGEGVVVGGSARGAHDSLFGTRAHLAMFNGGVIGEPVFGFGARSGNSYSFGEHGPETSSRPAASSPAVVAEAGVAPTCPPRRSPCTSTWTVRSSAA
jgi:hypothetical protein